MAYATIRRGSSGEGYAAFPQEGPPFSIPASLVLSLHLHEGMELDAHQFASLRKSARRLECREKALGFLAMREHTGLELKEKLRQRRFADDEIEWALASLRKDGSLDEGRYAEAYILSRERRTPEGRPLILARLRAKGVPLSLAREAVERAFAEKGDEWAREAWEQVAKTTRDEKKRVQKMQRRGFSYREIKGFLSEA